MRKKRSPGAPRHASVSKEKGNGPAACDHVYTYMVCAYVCAYVCVFVCALCPVKYEHAEVKPAIDRRKRREKEAVRTAARVKACTASPFEGENYRSLLFQLRNLLTFRRFRLSF